MGPDPNLPVFLCSSPEVSQINVQYGRRARGIGLGLGLIERDRDRVGVWSRVRVRMKAEVGLN